MRLDRLLAELDVCSTARLDRPAEVEVTSVTHDSRRVSPGALFCCVPGQNTDGHLHAPEAVDRGAVAVLAERPLGLSVGEVVVADARLQMGRVAAAFWGHPSSRLQVVGVTGTNGKTTTTWLLRAVLEAAGRPTGVIGTLGGPRTTPEAPDLQAALATMVDRGSEAVAMEVSSHALALSRVEGTSFAVAVFTNLGRDHLDFHASMDDYFAAKTRLFETSRTAAAVVNVDDPYGRILAERVDVPVRPFSMADVESLETGLRGSTWKWRGRRYRLALGGVANIANALAAATAALELGVDEEAVAEGLAEVPPVPGRYERVEQGQPFMVVVDYAHTPDALSLLLDAARAEADGARVTVVFGCGGDRDREKRPIMGRVAAGSADLVVLTDDNPRREDPVAILAAVSAGATGPGLVRVERDRRTAIRLALGAATAGDVVVVAGKGHETGQHVGDVILDFDDSTVVADELAALGYDGGARR